MDPLLYSQVKDLKDNEMSMPLLDNSENTVSKYKILKVTNRFDEHTADFSLDYVKIKELALTEKQLKTVKKWMEDKISPDTKIKQGIEGLSRFGVAISEFPNFLSDARKTNETFNRFLEESQSRSRQSQNYFKRNSFWIITVVALISLVILITG